MQMPTNSFNKRWSIRVECCHCCSARHWHYVYTVQRSAGCCRPLSSHWSPQWASNSGSLNWQQQLWRGSGEAGRLGGTGDGDTMAMDGGPGHTAAPHQGGGLSEGGCSHLTVYNHETISYWIYHMIPDYLSFCLSTYLFMPALFEMYRVCYFVFI